MRHLATVCLLFFAACGPLRVPNVMKPPPPGSTYFESASPDLEEADSAKGAAGPAAEADVATAGESEPERAIEEADIIRVDGTRLFALSEYRGLVAIDLSDLSNLRPIGSLQLQGLPFEMYFRDGVAYVLYNSYAVYVFDEQLQRGSWQSTSRVVALDVSDAAHIKEIGSFNLAGAISDSRIVGSVLYVVSTQSGYCWNCNSKPNVSVTSLQVGAPQDIKVIDQQTFEEPQAGYAWRRSVTVTSQRMYISGLTWTSNDNASSTIQVIDISNPNGTLHKGAIVPIAGQITSRWQMDEYQSVLRVVSQPFGWQSQASPTVQTFAVHDSNNVTALDSLVMQLPRPEQLRSVRFDRDRAYAVTFQRTDPLFVLDLSNPQHIVQAGELEIPGWIYHMEPRGNRLLAVGFDNNKLAVSLYDVSNIAQPTQLSRVIFGGEWGWMPEDQDRIHKAFNILQNEGLILMPFAGWSREENYFGRYISGVQLIDWSGDTLALRGIAPHKGSARRGFLYEGKLLAMSDDRVEAFDISNRDAPATLSVLPFSRNVVKTVTVGDHVVELVRDYWDQSARIDIVSKDNANPYSPIATLDLSSIAPKDRNYYYWYYGFGFGNVSFFAEGSLVYLVWGDSAWCGFCGYSRCTDAGAKTHIAVIDLSNAGKPVMRGQVEVDGALASGLPYYGSYRQLLTGTPMVKQGATIAIEQQLPYAQGDNKLLFFDVSNPDAPVLAKTVTSPYFFMNLQVTGTTIATSHFEKVPNKNAVRYFMDRFDIADPAAPKQLAPVNIPGSLAWLGDDSLLTVDYQMSTHPATSYEECQLGYLRKGTCYQMDRSLNALTLQNATTATLGQRKDLPGGWSTSLNVSASRIFVSSSNDKGVTEVAIGPNDGSLTQSAKQAIGAYGSIMTVANEKAFTLSYYPPALTVIDTADVAAPTLRTIPTRTWFQSVDLGFDAVTFSQGPYGVERIGL